MTYVAIACIAVAALVALGNLAGCIGALIRNKRGIDQGYSSIPLVSVVFCTLAWLLGGQDFGWLTFTPALLDPGTWMLVALPFVLFGTLVIGERGDARSNPVRSGPTGMMDTDVALRLLGPMASLAVQRRFVIGGTADSYGLASEFLDNAFAFVERTRATPIGALASVVELDKVLEDVGPHIPVSDDGVSNEVLIEEHPGWARVRVAAGRVLREMGAGFDEWERSELDCPHS